jgi:hypothetical protein
MPIANAPRTSAKKSGSRVTDAQAFATLSARIPSAAQARVALRRSNCSRRSHTTTRFNASSNIAGAALV